MSKVKYIPRNTLVLIRQTYVEKLNGIIMPECSIQGKAFIVEAFGPKVEGLEVGDQILLTGNKNETFWTLPNDSNLLVTDQAHVALVIRKGVEQ